MEPGWPEGDFLSRIYYFESLSGNPANGEDAIKTLIIDKDVPHSVIVIIYPVSVNGTLL